MSQSCACVLSYHTTTHLTANRYKIGEAFLHMSHSKAAERLEKDQAGIDQQVSTLTADAEDTTKQLTELQAMLYSKFGKAINLDE